MFRQILRSQNCAWNQNHETSLSESFTKTPFLWQTNVSLSHTFSTPLPSVSVTWKLMGKIPTYLEISWMICLRGRWGWSLTRGRGPSEAGEGEGGASGHQDHRGQRARPACPDLGRGGWGAAAGTGSPGRSGWRRRAGGRQNLARENFVLKLNWLQYVWKSI